MPQISQKYHINYFIFYCCLWGIMKYKASLFAFATISIFISNSAHAGELAISKNIYEGTLGNQKIVFETIEYEPQNGKNIMAAKYFYNTQRMSINLISPDNSYNFQELDTICTHHDEPDCKLNGKFILNKSNDKLIGNWQAVKTKKSYGVNLKYIGSASFKLNKDSSEPKDTSDLLELFDDDYLDASNDIYKQKLAEAGTAYSKEKLIYGFGYKIATDKITGVHYPILSSSPSGISLDNINNALKFQRYNMINYAHQCHADLQEGAASKTANKYGDWGDYETTVKYINNDILVLEESGSTYCGGAHPNNTYDHTVWDMKTGKQIKESDLFTTYVKKGDYDEEATPEYKAFYNKVISDKKYILNNNELDPECKQQDDSWYHFTTYPDKNGVIFSLEDLPHVVGACMGDYYIVSYKEMEQFMTPYAKTLFAKNLKK